MERRREHRFTPNQSATVTVLGLRPGPVIETHVLDMSGSGLRLKSKLPAPCGASVEIEAEHVVARGTVARCEPVADAYELGIQISQIEPARAPQPSN